MVTSASGVVPSKGFHPFQWMAASIPIIFQLVGLTMETIADYQKSFFKLHSRYEWCNVGLWSYSTHPNYLGEWIFWTGTYLGWILFNIVAATSNSGRLPSSQSVLARIGQFLFCTLGYGFITTVLRGSIQSMSNKHWQKYGHIPEYATFRQSHGLMGPKRAHTMVDANSTAEDGNATVPRDETMTNGNDEKASN